MKIYVKKNAVEGGWGVFKASKHVLKMALKQGGAYLKGGGYLNRIQCYSQIIL